MGQRRKLKAHSEAVTAPLDETGVEDVGLGEEKQGEAIVGSVVPAAEVRRGRNTERDKAATKEI